MANTQVTPPVITDGTVSLQRITAEDIKDPQVNRLNRTFLTISEYLTRLSGGSGPFTFLSNMNAPKLFSNLADPSIVTQDNQFLTLAAAKKVFGDNVGKQGPPGAPGGVVSAVRIEHASTTVFPASIAAEVAVLLGERPSLNSYGGVGDGTTDNRGALQALINAVSGNGGGIVSIPTGNYALTNYVTVPANVWIIGAGVASKFTRTGTVTTGFGLLTVTGDNVLLDNFLIDGAVTSSATILYSSNPQPEDAVLTNNSSVWIRPGVNGFTMSQVRIQHTGGYGVFIDVRTASSSNFLFDECYFTNNRPHLFSDGTIAGGSWTGGIYVASDCQSSAPFFLNGLRISNCHWSRVTGTCFWSHSLGFAVHHLMFRVSDCTFEYCGLDAVQFGNVLGGGVRTSDFHAIGYVTTTDSSTPVPTYVPGIPPVAIDTTGYTSSVMHTGNTMVSINGIGFDLDGMRDSSIIGNTIFIPAVGDPQYTTDSVALFGYIISGSLKQVSKGINSGNSNQNGAAANLVISGNQISGMGQSAIVMNYAKLSSISNNAISHPSGALGVPIVLFGVTGSSPASEWQCHDNTTTMNHINYAGSNFCIIETGGQCFSNVTYNNTVVQ